MTDSWAQTRGPGGLLARSVLLILLLVVIGACASTQQSAQTSPASPDPTVTVRSIDELQAEAESYFDFGEEAYRRGEYATAHDRFQRALDVYLDADIRDEDREALQVSFNDLFNRIHALEIEGLINPDGDRDLVSLDDEELPAPSEEDLAVLRSRLEVSPPALPKFAIPIPSPLDNDRVAWAITYLSGERKEVIEEGLSRATSYMPMIEAIFDEEGVPRELAWSALIESLFKTGAYSRAAAVGMWQFVSGTARLYGLQVGSNVDERRDPVRATRMAAIYLRDLYQEFGDWALVLAAYNAGKGRVGRAMERTGADDFWTLDAQRALPRETRDHVPKIYAAILIATDPDYYGFNITPQPLYTYDESVMDENTDLRLVAELVGESFEEIRELNPHIQAWVPKGYAVRIPAGTKAAFETALAAVPPGERIEFLTHVVARGDTLSDIASQYGTRVSSIMEVNNLRNANRLSIGQRLAIPVGPTTRQYRAQPVAGFSTGERTTYTVQRGDSLYDIAQSFRTDIPNVMRWNNLTSTLIYPGDELIVYYGVRGDMATPAAVSADATASAGAGDSSGDTGPSSAGGVTPAVERGLYTVRRGDSLYDIAQRYDVSVEELKSWNDRRSNTIHPGDKLVVYSPAMVTTGGSGGAAVNTVRRYTVARGDSPYLIAERYGVDLDALLTANGLTRRSSIYPGDQLLIPSGGTMPSVTSYTVRRGDTLGTIAQNHGVSLRSLLQANNLSSRSVIYPGDTLRIPGRD